MKSSQCQNCRRSSHSPLWKKEMTDRLSRIEGQIRGISRMIEEDIYCDDVLNQIASASSALNGVKKVLLEAHLKSCVVDQIRNGEDSVLDELMKTLSKLIK